MERVNDLEVIMSGELSSPYAFYAFYQLYNYLNDSRPSKDFTEICQTLYPTYEVNPTVHSSLFITWSKKSRDSYEYNLRGCIGTFAKPPVVQGIAKYSLIAALQDSRFSPITKDELPLLKCSCNILQNFTTIFEASSGNIDDWEIGLNGIELLFRDPGSGLTLSATFLPEVMSEQGWSKEETFLSLIKKAGVVSRPEYVLANYQKYFVQVIKYEGNKSAITYGPFKTQLEELN